MASAPEQILINIASFQCRGDSHLYLHLQRGCCYTSGAPQPWRQSISPSSFSARGKISGKQAPMLPGGTIAGGGGISSAGSAGGGGGFGGGGGSEAQGPGSANRGYMLPDAPGALTVSWTDSPSTSRSRFRGSHLSRCSCPSPSACKCQARRSSRNLTPWRGSPISRHVCRV